jgi:uncharacterized protein (TIGR03086 family)
MTELPSLFDEAVRQFSTRVALVSDDDWGKPTPDSEWSVADLVMHVIDEHRWMPPLLAGHDLDTAGKIVAGSATSADSDRSADWASASVASRQAVGGPGALDESVHLSRGLTPATEYLVEMIFDATVHSWDLAVALDADASLPDELVSFLFPVFLGMGDLSASGMFAAPVPVPDDASTQDRLIAATGRRPR